MSNNDPIPKIQFELAGNLFRHSLRSEMSRLLLRSLRAGHSIEGICARVRMSEKKLRQIVFGPGEITLDDVSDVLLAMGHELAMRASPLEPLPAYVTDEGNVASAA